MKRVVLVVVVLLSLVALSLIPGGSEQSVYTGMCVKSGDNYAVLFNGSSTILITRGLETGRIYTVKGHVKDGESGPIMRPTSISQGGSMKLEEFRGVYWSRNGWYLFSKRGKLRLAGPLNVTPATEVILEGVYYNGIVYPVRLLSKSPTRGPRNGFPWMFEGVVFSRRTVWNGSDRVTVYPPHGTELVIGTHVRVTGMVRVGARITVYASNVSVLGYAPEVPIEATKTGEMGTGSCLVLRGGDGLIKLNCTNLSVYGAKANTGDLLKVRVLNRGTSMICVRCTVLKSRREMPNGICSWREGKLGKVHGTVEWVKRYASGFGIANVTNGECSILVKLPSSLGFTPSKGDVITVYGEFVLYRGVRSIQPAMKRDVCYGRC